MHWCTPISGDQPGLAIFHAETSMLCVKNMKGACKAMVVAIYSEATKS